MISSTTDYKAAVVADTRRVHLSAVIDIISPDVVYGSVTSTGLAPYSVPAQLHDHEFTLDRVATLEHNRWLLDGSFGLIPIDGQSGVATQAVCGDDGMMSEWVELQFSNVSILQACSIYFSDDVVDGIPVDFTVEVKQGNNVYHTETFTGNTETKVSLSGFTVYDPDAIRVTVTKMNVPRRRLRIAEILLGIYEEWDGSIISRFSVKHQGDVSCTSLPYGTCTIAMDNLDRRFEPRKKNGLFQSIEERQGIPISIGVELPDKTIEYKQIGVFYQFSGGWKTGDNGLTMEWDLVDIVGMLSGREFIPPTTLPTTLSGWAAALVSQLGTNFGERYTVDPDYEKKAVSVRERADVEGKTCGELIQHLGQATGTWARADAETGNLCFEPLWSQGNKITLDNLEAYPVIRANDDIAAIVFSINDGNDTKYTVNGTSTASSKTASINNPFIRDTASALVAAKQILSAYGGNQYDVTGRGDPAGEIGDVALWLDESSAASARRIKQDLSFSDGVLKNCKSTLLQPDGSLQFNKRAIITQSGTFTTPTGVTALRVILVGRGETGAVGQDGSWDAAGENGTDGRGGLVWYSSLNVNANQQFTVTIGEHTTFGQYSSANGKIYEYGFTDIASGNTYARTGVKKPSPGTGDGGAGGRGGVRGETHERTDSEGFSHTVIDNYPGEGENGAEGASGCAIVYWEAQDE